MKLKLSSEWTLLEFSMLGYILPEKGLMIIYYSSVSVQHLFLKCQLLFLDNSFTFSLFLIAIF